MSWSVIYLTKRTAARAPQARKCGDRAAGGCRTRRIPGARVGTALALYGGMLSQTIPAESFLSNPALISASALIAHCGLSICDQSRVSEALRALGAFSTNPTALINEALNYADEGRWLIAAALVLAARRLELAA